ncbi:hypothetical protein RHMOL_Rhmol08G0215400 [Rhododendron molle]|uniref:Uncharacterized protein n=1 Tax=Rhododendron molle TaxID=49168 RepID=A0ACC0MQS9_RHOML|nr:hypothetical protein RHMOL_Rhmol08G0215400 [Rhododendron molle]
MGCTHMLDLYCQGLIRSLQQMGCTHMLDLYCQGLTSRKGQFKQDLEFSELQKLVLSINHASKESTEYIYSTMIKLQIFYHLDRAWNLCWRENMKSSTEMRKLLSEPDVPTLDQLEEAKLWQVQGQHEMAINLADSRTILERYLKRAFMFAEDHNHTDKKSITRQSQAHFHLAHYSDALYRSYEERLNSNEWQAAMRLRKHKGKKNDYSVKIQELQKQLAMDKEEDERLQGDKDNFLSVALEGYKRCLVIGDKYDVRVVFRLVSLWFSLSSRQIVVNGMFNTIEEVQSYKFIPLVYQIASRMGSKDGHGPHSFQFSWASLVKKMAIDHPYHTIF